MLCQTKNTLTARSAGIATARAPEVTVAPTLAEERAEEIRIAVARALASERAEAINIAIAEALAAAPNLDYRLT